MHRKIFIFIFGLFIFSFSESPVQGMNQTDEEIAKMLQKKEKKKNNKRKRDENEKKEKEKEKEEKEKEKKDKGKEKKKKEDDNNNISPITGDDYDDNNVELKMGAEIETSALKVILEEYTKKDSGLLVEKAGHKWWQMEGDTQDGKQTDGFNAYNLELKTCGGFTHDAFLEVFGMMHPALLQIFQKTPVNKFNEKTRDEFLFNSEKLAEYINISKSSNISTSKYGKPIYVIMNDNMYTVVKPQITYQLPLARIPNVFAHLVEMEDSDIVVFWNALSSNYEMPLNRSRLKDVDRILIQDNKIKTHNLLQFFNGLKIVNEMDARKFTPALKGFTYLFLYYWATIFNNNRLNNLQLTTGQVGLKAFIGVMSRIPFSELYDHALNKKEQTKFKEFIQFLMNQPFNIEEGVHTSHTFHIPEEGQTHIGGALKAGDACLIREYRNGNFRASHNLVKGETPDEKGIVTLRQWYESIVDNSERNKDNDKLSPPIYNAEVKESMGVYKWQDVQAPLIEVRDYAGLFHNSVKEKFSMRERMAIALPNFVIEECKWFFIVSQEVDTSKIHEHILLEQRQQATQESSHKQETNKKQKKGKSVKQGENK